MKWPWQLRLDVDRHAIRLVTRLLRENAASEWPGFVTSFLLLSVVSVATAGTAYLMEDVVNQVFMAEDASAVSLVAGAVAGVFVVKGVAGYANALVVARVSMRIVARLQKRFYASLMRQGLDFYQAHRGGQIMNRFTHNSQAARAIIQMVAMTFWRDLFSLVALVAVMVIQSPLMSLCTLLIGPPAVLGTMYLMRQTKDFASKEAQEVGLTSAILKETVDNVRVVKAFTLESLKGREMDAAIRRVQERGFKLTRLSALTIPLMEVLAGLSIGVAILFAGYQIQVGIADPGVFFSFVAAFLMAYDPARRLARFNVDFQRKLVGLELFYEMIDQVGSDTDRPDARELVVRDGEIRLDRVSFDYGKSPALHDVSFTMPAGRMTALVGPSGAGKTTILSLLERFYDPTTGAIRIDGQDLREVAVASLRRHIAIVTQDPQLFECSIKENIRLGRLDADDDAVERAARAANAHDFIETLPDGYDTQAGTAGSRLSGGQKQRISIARAILRDAPILLLDEATSALDTLSEIAVQEALGRLMEGRTTVAIAHRLSTIYAADRIVVLDHGRVVEQGRHDELVTNGGLYAHLYDQQVERMKRSA